MPIIEWWAGPHGSATLIVIIVRGKRTNGRLAKKINDVESFGP